MQTVLADITVHGEPVAKARPRMVRTCGGVRTYTPQRTVAWEDKVAAEANGLGQCVRNGAVLHIDLTFVMPRPKRLGKRDVGRVVHDRKPDIDNLIKAALDGLTRGGLLSDDAIVSEIMARKVYAALDESAHVRIVVVG